jgi:diacylglycerol kinase (ATP)
MTDRRATIIYNPMSGQRGRRADNARKMVQLLAARGVTAEAVATQGPDDATRLAREAVKDGANIIVSYGGDGTLNEVIQGMAGQGMVGRRASLAIWPGGTSNVIARDLGITPDIEALAGLISQEKTKRISLGVARSNARSQVAGSGEREEAKMRQYVSAENLSLKENLSVNLNENAEAVSDSFTRLQVPDTRPLERYFLMMAGIGLDASIARGVNRRLKRRTGEFAYWVTGIKHLFTWQADPFILEVDGKSYEGVFAIIGNGKGYGGGMCITPHAKLDEPLFEVYILQRRANNFAYLPALAACMRGNPENKGVTLVKASHIKANSTHEPWVEADGEIIGPLPMTFDIVPDALSLIVP